MTDQELWDNIPNPPHKRRNKFIFFTTHNEKRRWIGYSKKENLTLERWIAKVLNKDFQFTIEPIEDDKDIEEIHKAYIFMTVPEEYRKYWHYCYSEVERIPLRQWAISKINGYILNKLSKQHKRG